MMPVGCQKSDSGRKGNLGMFIERNPLPTAQPDSKMKDCLQHYLLQDEADALIHDAITPPKPPRRFPPPRRPLPRDTRNAAFFTNVKEIMFPENATKFQTLVEDSKNTVYASYWKPVGEPRDPTPMLPAGLPKTATFGKKYDLVSLYDVILPKTPLPDKTPPYKEPGVQKTRKYCESFNPNARFGSQIGVNQTGVYVKKCLTYDNVENGIVAAAISSRQANYLQATQAKLGQGLAPCDNIKQAPKGSSFGVQTVPPIPSVGSFTTCEIYPEKALIMKCFAHLSSVRKCLRAKFLPDFFLKFYLLLKSFDKEKSGWLAKDIVYEQCVIKMIKFDSFLIETLLALWKAYDGSKIEYKTFVHMLNYTQPSREIPTIPDIPDSCLNCQTTYMEMVEPRRPDVSPMAGVPSGRYLDCDYPITPEDFCKANRIDLQQESDVRSCLNPSVFTLHDVNHRDMYTKREPQLVRKVFENVGEGFTDDSFKEIWQKAEKYHSQGWVCFETFRWALKNQTTK